MIDTKLCGRCGSFKPVDDFTKNSATKDGLQTWCRHCKNDHRRETRRKNRKPRFCKSDDCGIELVNPEKAQKYCSPLCRSKNYTWESQYADCIKCEREKKYRAQSYCLLCMQADNHNLTYDDIENILLSQLYRCPVCHKEIETSFNIDHDHRCCDTSNGTSCGFCVRGILHQKCNKSLGNFNDDPLILRRAADYIERNLINV